jgi:hypothetical protein
MVLKHSFLGNGRETDNEMTSIARQQILNKQVQMAPARERLSKHIPVETVSIREWTMSVQAVTRSYKEENWGDPDSSVWESEEKSQWQLSSQLIVRQWSEN